jgi:hypothetical protein
MFLAFCLAVLHQPLVKAADPADVMMIPAAMLLEDPPGVPLYASGDGQKSLMLAFSKLGVMRQLLDPREQRYLFVRESELESDLNVLRRRRVELNQAPLVSESEWLPNRAYANDLIRFNRSYRKHLEGRMMLELDRLPQLQVVMKENDTCYRLWDYMRDARCEFYYITVRRTALLNLKRELSELKDDAGNYWETRRLPPYVPHWRFQEMK